MSYKLYFFPLFLVFFVCGIFSASAEESKQDRAIRAVKELCLAGSQYDFKLDARGNLTLIKLAPGAEGSVSVNVRESAGAAAIFDDKVRLLADKDIRDCISPYIKQIIDAILNDSKPAVREISWQATYPQVGIPNQVDCPCLTVVKKNVPDGAPGNRLPSNSSISIENKCTGSVSIIASKDLDFIPTKGGENYFSTTHGRYWAPITLDPAEKITLGFGGAWGGGIGSTSCAQ